MPIVRIPISKITVRRTGAAPSPKRRSMIFRTDPRAKPGSGAPIDPALDNTFAVKLAADDEADVRVDDVLDIQEARGGPRHAGVVEQVLFDGKLLKGRIEKAAHEAPQDKGI